MTPNFYAILILTHIMIFVAGYLAGKNNNYLLKRRIRKNLKKMKLVLDQNQQGGFTGRNIVEPDYDPNVKTFWLRKDIVERKTMIDTMNVVKEQSNGR